jgi:Uma2 family endonuclease
MLVEANPTAETIADLLRDLGDVPPERVRMKPPPGTATEQDAVDLADRQKRFCEFVDGVLVEKPMSELREASLAVLIATYLNIFILPRKLGRVFGPDGMMRLRPGLVRIPDVSFLSRSALPGKIPDVSILGLAPNLAVEVLSKSNTRREMARKRQEYFAAGTKLVWEFDAKSRTVDVYTGPEEFITLKENQVLDGGSVLPGLSISLSELFGHLDD